MHEQRRATAPLSRPIQLVDGRPSHRTRQDRGKSRTAEPSSAWLVPSTDPSAWLAEAVALQLPWRDVLVLPMPHSRRDPNARGALLVLRQARGAAPRDVARNRPGPRIDYVCRAGCVYLPAGAELHPPTTDDELRALAADHTLVFDPVAGLVAFAPADTLTLVALLARQDSSPERPSAGEPDSSWTFARPGTYAGRKLQAVIGPDPDLESFFEAAANSIGNRSPHALSKQRSKTRGKPVPTKSLPRPQEPRLGSRGSRLSRSIARLALGMTKHVPRTADKPTWIDRIEQWAKAKLSTHTAARASARADSRKSAPRSLDESRRQREIQRLLQLLADDPSEGLRYALPLANNMRTRGTTRGSDSLGRGDADYRYDDLSRFAPSDPWELSLSQRIELQTHYRNLANSEAAAGSYRRAAYISAHLLGELRSAAKLLEEGGHHREAAQLYREQLDDLEAASHCLAAGGRLAEAAQLEIEREQWRNAGDLYLLLGDRTRSDALYEQAYNESMLRHQPLAAAMLRAERLRAPHQALSMLDELQQQDPNDVSIYAARLALAHRLDKDAALVRMLHEQPAAAAAGRYAAAIGLLATRRPNGSLRERIGDRVRQLMAQMASEAARDATPDPATRRDLQRGLTAMLRSSPLDAALHADVQLYRQSTRKKNAAADYGQQQAIPLRGPLHLKRQRAHVIANGAAQLAAANSTDILLLSATRRAQSVSMAWHPETDGTDDRHTLVAGQFSTQHRLGSSDATVELRCNRRDDSFTLSISSRDAGSDAPIGHARAAAVCQTLRKRNHDYVPVSERRREAWIASDYTREGDFVSLRYVDASVVLETQRGNGARSRTEVVPGLMAAAAGDAPIFIAAVRDQVVVACGRSVLVWDSARWHALHTASEITSVARMDSNRASQVAIGMKRGLHVFHSHKAYSYETTLEHLAPELVAPTLGWTQDRLVVAIDTQHVWFAQATTATQGRAVSGDRLSAYTSGQPRKILTGPDARSLAFVFDQLVTIEQVAGRIATISP